jgi:chromosome segregation ATPase
LFWLNIIFNFVRKRDTNSGSMMRPIHLNKIWPIVILILIGFVFFPSCVSKRKFLLIEESRNQSQNKVKELTTEVEILKKDFEEYRITSRNDLTSKQNYVDSLSRIVFLLNTDITSKDNNIQDQTFSFQVEKGRLNQELSEREKEIRNLTREVNTLKVQIDDLVKKLEDATSNKRFPFGQVKQLERKLQTRDLEITELKLKLVDAQSDTDSLSAKINELTIEIERLNETYNPVKLDSIGN